VIQQRPLSSLAAGAPRPVRTAEPGVRDRADMYGLLAALLAEPPGLPLLQRLAEVQDEAASDETPIVQAWRRLGREARAVTPAAASEEFHALFIGVTQGELVPYGSWYQTGFLMERPLVRLRSDLARLGFARQEGVHEPEDHAAALCEVMGLLIMHEAEGDETVRTFFQDHLASWMPAFFLDLQTAPSAVLYAAVGALGEQFLELERRYLSLAPGAGDAKQPIRAKGLAGGKP